MLGLRMVIFFKRRLAARSCCIDGAPVFEVDVLECPACQGRYPSYPLPTAGHRLDVVE